MIRPHFPGHASGLVGFLRMAEDPVFRASRHTGVASRGSSLRALSLRTKLSSHLPTPCNSKVKKLSAGTFSGLWRAPDATPVRSRTSFHIRVLAWRARSGHFLRLDRDSRLVLPHARIRARLKSRGRVNRFRRDRDYASASKPQASASRGASTTARRSNLTRYPPRLVSLPE